MFPVTPCQSGCNREPLGLAGSGRGKHRQGSQQAHATATFQGVPIADGRVGFVGFVHVTAGRS